MPAHHHPTKDETFIILRGKVKVSTFNDDGTIRDSIILSHEDGRYGVDILKNVWHTLECIESATISEVKEGPFVPHEE